MDRKSVPFRIFHSIPIACQPMLTSYERCHTDFPTIQISWTAVASIQQWKANKTFHTQLCCGCGPQSPQKLSQTQQKSVAKEKLCLIVLTHSMDEGKKWKRCLPINGNANIGFWQIFGQKIKIRLWTVAVCSTPLYLCHKMPSLHFWMHSWEQANEKPYVEN